MENNVGTQGVSTEFITRKELMVRLQISEPHAIKLDRLGVLKRSAACWKQLGVFFIIKIRGFSLLKLSK
jgi:hypothetical protein